jgi:hypothetical protein
MLLATFASLQRVLGPSHPTTLQIASSLDTRVLVQRFVAKPEHNGKRARVLSFDSHTGRYAVALDDCRSRPNAWRRPGARRRAARRRRRAACALDARGCGTARASASAQTGRRITRCARRRGHERWRVGGSFVPCLVMANQGWVTRPCAPAGQAGQAAQHCRTGLPRRAPRKHGTGSVIAARPTPLAGNKPGLASWLAPRFGAGHGLPLPQTTPGHWQLACLARQARPDWVRRRLGVLSSTSCI